MEIIWKENAAAKTPILFKQEAVWEEFSVRRLRVLPGRTPEQKSDNHEINLTISGNVITQRFSSIGKKRIDCRGKNGMCIVPSGQAVQAEWEKEYECVRIDFTPKYLVKTATEMNLSSNVELLETISTKDLLVQQLSLAFLEEASKNEIPSRLYADSIAHTLMFHIVKNYTNSVATTKQFVGGLSAYKFRRVTEFINENLEQDLTLTEIAEVADLSHFHFSRAFHKTAGVTPQKYIANRRIEKAKELLKNSDLPIVEIGFQTGFKNQSHFTTLFRKFTSFTPRIWREANQT